jgi:hypothetical protein
MDGARRPTERRIFDTAPAESSTARRRRLSYIAAMASTLHRHYNDRLPPPATAHEIERRVPGNQTAVAGIFSFEDGIMSKLGPRRTIPTLVVGLVYVALVIAAPLIVRYAPQPEVASAVVHTAVPAR